MIIDDAVAYENVNTSYPYLHARLIFDGETLDNNIGVCLKGHISIQLTEGHRYPLKLDFNRYKKGQNLDGLKKLNLNTDFNGPTLPILRDYLSYEALPGRFTLLPWDMNGSQEPQALPLCSPLEGILSGRLLRNSIYQARYFDIMTNFLETTGSADWLIARLDAAQALLGSEISAEEVEDLRRDIRTRTARLRSELDSMTWCE